MHIFELKNEFRAQLQNVEGAHVDVANVSPPDGRWLSKLLFPSFASISTIRAYG
jgi:hypothetical protein